MKKLRLLLLAFWIFVPAVAFAGDVSVRGYFRSNGTYVAPHYRSAPDGNFYNNWSTKGNINPYTGEPGTKVTPPSGYGRSSTGTLAEYYRNHPTTSESIPIPSASLNLPVLDGIIDDSEVARSIRYCGRLYQKPSDNQKCVFRQARTLASIALPDYSSLPERDVARSTSYCERLYGDDRAGFYNCVNRQYFGISQPESQIAGLPVDDVRRAKMYCERLYGDDRAGYARCFDNQQNSLASNLGVSTSGIPSAEWSRANRYCERLYGDDRGGAAGCKRNQASSLSHVNMSRYANSADAPYCERLYGDDRAGFWRCVQ